MRLGLRLFGLVMTALIGAPVFAQNLAQPAVSSDCGSAQSCTAQLGSNVTAGSSLIAVVRLTPVTPTIAGTTITDSRSNTWVLDAWVAQPGNIHILGVYRAIAANAGAISFTVSNAASSTMRIVCLAEITGLTAGAPDAQSSAVGTGTTARPGSLATTQPNDYVLAAAATDNNQSFSTLEPFLIESQVTRGAYADALPPQAATLTPAISFGVADRWLAIALAYKTSGSPRLPVFLSLHYDDGTPVAGSVVLSSLVGGVKTAIQTSLINSNGLASLYCPIVTTGTYEYDFLDPNGIVIQSDVVLPGAFASLIAPAHSMTGAITIGKNSHAVTIPVSFSFQ